MLVEQLPSIHEVLGFHSQDLTTHNPSPQEKSYLVSGLGYTVSGLHETLSQKVSSSPLNAAYETAKTKYQRLETGLHSTKRQEGLAKELQVKVTVSVYLSQSLRGWLAMEGEKMETQPGSILPN